MKTKLEQFREIEKALDVLKGDFESQLEYIEEIKESNGNQGVQHLLTNLEYLIQDNSREAYTRLKAIDVLISFADNIKESEKIRQEKIEQNEHQRKMERLEE